MNERPPRENVVRASSVGFSVRSEGAAPVIHGYFNRVGEWAEIDSMAEGHFMERFAEGAWVKTIRHHRDRVRMLFQHGQDPSVGSKPIASIDVLRDEAEGGYYEGTPLDTEYARDVLAGIEAGVYGVSMRFSVEREIYDGRPEPSEYNPDGIPERTVTEASLLEFGPVTFPAYAGATVGVRSMTDELLYGPAVLNDPKRLAQVIEYAERTAHPHDPPPAPTPAPDTAPAPVDAVASPVARRASNPKGTAEMDIDRFDTIELLVARRDEVAGRVAYLHTDAAGKAFTPEVQAEWDELNAEHAAITERMAHLQAREAKVAELAARPAVTDRGDASAIGVDFQVRKPAKVENIYDLPAHRAAAIKDGDEGRLLRESAIRSIETSRIPAPKGYDVERMREMAQTTLERLDGTEEDGAPRGALAAYYLATGSPTYRRAFGKFAASSPAPALFMPEESAAIHQAETWSKRAFTLGSTGLPVPYQLDPTIMPISNSSVNPYRAIGRVVQTTVKNWRGATSAGITAAYVAEATEATDDTPTLAQPTIDAQRAQAFVPFSIEVDQDWSEVEGEMLREVADAKDDLEATKFTLGSGTNEPFGLIVGATTLTNTTTTGAFVIADLYKMEEALPPRFRPRAEIVGTRFVFNKARQFDTAGGSGVWLDGLQVGLANEVPTPGQIGPRLLGYPAWECSAMDAVLTTGSEILVMGQFDPYFTIVDRVGMSADLIPHLVGTNHRPTGQRGLYFMWRNGSKVINAAAFRTLQT